MSNDDLDGAILEIIRKARRPITIRRIERLVADQNSQADTYDVQRAVQRLVDAGRASLTQRLDITAAAL